jgi:hypothetical protein
LLSVLRPEGSTSTESGQGSQNCSTPSTSFISRNKLKNLPSIKCSIRLMPTHLRHHHTTTLLSHHLRHTIISFIISHHHLHITNTSNHHHLHRMWAPQTPKANWPTTYNSHHVLCTTELHLHPNTTATPIHVNSLCAMKMP